LRQKKKETKNKNPQKKEDASSFPPSEEEKLGLKETVLV